MSIGARPAEGSSSTNGSQAGGEPPASKVRHARVDGIEMRWVEHGAGAPVVLAHGIPTSPALWRHVAPLVPDLRLLAWELVGYGESIPQGQGRDIAVARQADYLIAWMRSIGCGPAVLVGHDIGGGVVQIAAVRQPTICSGLVLANAVAYDSWPIPSVRAMRSLGFLLARAPMPILKAALTPLFRRGHEDARIARESLPLHLAAYAEHGGGEALLRQMQSLDCRDTLQVQDRLPQLGDRPARVVWGEADPFQKLRYGERLAADLRGELVRVPRARHFLPEDRPGVLAGAIAAVARLAS